MSTKPIGKLYFPLYRKTTGDAKKTNPDPSGHFSCTTTTGNFLEIVAKSTATTGLATKKRNSYTRNTILADGNSLTPNSGTAGTTLTVSESQVPISNTAKGSRTVVIKTGKKIPDRTVGSKVIKGGYHTVSFRFPGWATIEIISDALGTLIDAAKLDVTPTEAKVFPYFTVKGGRKYVIMERSAAKEDTTSDVSTTLEEAQTMAQTAGIKLRKGAGGDA